MLMTSLRMWMMEKFHHLDFPFLLRVREFFINYIWKDPQRLAQHKKKQHWVNEIPRCANMVLCDHVFEWDINFWMKSSCHHFAHIQNNALVLGCKPHNSLHSFSASSCPFKCVILHFLHFNVGWRWHSVVFVHAHWRMPRCEIIFDTSSD